MSFETNKKKLVVVDGNHLIHRAFYAIQSPLKTSFGEQTNAVYGFASMMLNILDQDHPDFFIVTFDEKGPTFRHEMHEEYKGTRTKAPDELYAQMPRIREMVEAFKVPVVSKEGYEADDMMGSLAMQAKKQGIVSYLITGDMDLLQLVDPDVFVVFPHKGYKEPIIYDAEAVYNKYAINPAQVIDYKALVGDNSDNIKGVAGIGPKGASKLLHDYGDLDGIYEHLKELPVAMQKKLTDDQDSAYFSKSLATIVTDAPCEFDHKKSSFDELDFLGLLKFFEKMEMKSLVGRLRRMVPEDKLSDKKQLSLF